MVELGGWWIKCVLLIDVVIVYFFDVEGFEWLGCFCLLYEYLGVKYIELVEWNCSLGEVGE